MRSRTAKPRIVALILAFIGFVLAGVNHQTVMTERHYYPMLMLFGPVCALFGIAGAIDPRVMNQSGVQTEYTVAIFRLIAIGLVITGLAIGWAMGHFWYHIW